LLKTRSSRKSCLSKKIKTAAERFPVVALTGPRQSGKTTLVRSVFKNKPYVSFENPDMRNAAISDPRGFLNNYDKGAIFDEVQRVPHIFSYLQQIVDEAGRSGMYILTGSQQFLLLENLTQTLAGRVAILKLLPLTIGEVLSTSTKLKTVESVLFKGFFPRLYDKELKPEDWFPNYVQTYLERDVRMIKNIDDLHTFQTFMKLCAGRTGQLLNLTSLANDCAISPNTAKAWINILEASFIIHLLFIYSISR